MTWFSILRVAPLKHFSNNCIYYLFCFRYKSSSYLLQMKSPFLPDLMKVEFAKYFTGCILYLTVPICITTFPLEKFVNFPIICNELFLFTKITTSMKSTDWLNSIQKRHSTLSIWTHQSTSWWLPPQPTFDCNDICNADETGITTVQRLDRIIARKVVQNRQGGEGSLL